eukprot:TRINITY_DN62121_c0_g1_i1.p1 TRINITY_DN62121_c0_g1~~TRINITY_DN62121_c0_g1_i1.p1  ORF type:complete len:580 (-),score=61.20 TRINITY_DN62121_c0_g1_i1:154-1893(-)
MLAPGLGSWGSKKGPKRQRPRLRIDLMLLLPVLISLLCFTVPLLYPIPTRAFPTVSNEELAALSLVVYYEDMLGSRAAFPVEHGHTHTVQGWVCVRRAELEARDLRVDVYRSYVHRAYVVAVRGTVLSQENLRANYAVAIGNIDDNLVEMIHHLSEVVREVAAVSKRKRWPIYLTGHSLGAYLACLAYFHMAGDRDLRQRIMRVVLFESPGVPELKTGSDAIFSVEDQPWFAEAKERIVEFLGAPNMINMVHRHIGGEVYRVKKYHCLVVNKLHVLKCTLGSASFVLNVATLGCWIWAQMSQLVHWRGISVDADTWIEQLSRYRTLRDSELDAWAKRQYINWIIVKGRAKYWLKMHARSFLHDSRPLVEMVDAYYLAANILKLTRLLTSFSTFARASLGISDELAWTLQQHGMLGFWQSFDAGADLPRDSSYQIVKAWPRGNKLSAVHLAKTSLRGVIPFHPAVPGLHNVGRPNRMTEARVCTMHGYKFQEPSKDPVRLWAKPWQIIWGVESPLHVRRKLRSVSSRFQMHRRLRQRLRKLRARFEATGMQAYKYTKKKFKRFVSRLPKSDFKADLALLH